MRPPWYVMPWRIWDRGWSSRHENGGRRLQFWMIGATLVFLAIPYGVINHLVHWIGISRMDPVMWVDDATPFIAWTIIPYASLYLYYPAAALASPRDDRGRLQMIMLHQVLFISAAFVYIIFLTIPTHIHIRSQIPEEILAGEGFWGFWYGGFMHVTDNPWNAWPSLHIIQSLLIVLVLNRWFAGRGVWICTIWIGWVMLAISVMTTKQHFFFDLVTGVIVALVFWLWLLRPALDWTATTESEEWLAES